MKLSQWLLGAVLMMGSSMAMGHGFWVDERTSQLAIVLGEYGDDLRYDADAVERVWGLDKTLFPIIIKTTPTANNVLVHPPKGTAVLLATFKPNYYTKDRDGKWHNKPKNQVTGAVSGTAYVNSNVTLLDHQASAVPFGGLSLQVIALKDPFTLNIGDELPVQVFFDGKPLAWAKIAPDYINNPKGNIITADDDGKATIKIASTGITVIQSHHEIDNDSATLADKTYYNATLAFNLFNQKHP